MQNRDTIQAQINAMVAELHAIADRVNERIDREYRGLTPEEEAEIFVIEERIKSLRKRLDS